MDSFTEKFFIELSEIEDIDLKNKIIEDFGQSNLNNITLITREGQKLYKVVNKEFIKEYIPLNEELSDSGDIGGEDETYPFSSSAKIIEHYCETQKLLKD